ncbi:rRNA methylase [Francisella tularensis subsp. holarctica 257]|nr:rRNA methylase [Francisella tularensis subsp. holarctica 257]
MMAFLLAHYNISETSFSTNIFRINYSFDFLAKLPMLGEVSSLNVSVATGIALYETVRQRTNTI